MDRRALITTSNIKVIQVFLWTPHVPLYLTYRCGAQTCFHLNHYKLCPWFKEGKNNRFATFLDEPTSWLSSVLLDETTCALLFAKKLRLTTDGLQHLNTFFSKSSVKTASFESRRRLQLPGMGLWTLNTGYCTFSVDIRERNGGMLRHSRSPVHHVDSSLLLFHLLSSFQRLNEVFILISSYHSSLVRKRESMPICHSRAQRAGMVLSKQVSRGVKHKTLRILLCCMTQITTRFPLHGLLAGGDTPLRSGDVHLPAQRH